MGQSLAEGESGGQEQGQGQERPGPGCRPISNVKTFRKGELRRSCGEFGCEKARRTDPAIFAPFLPGGVAVGDLDGILERRGRFLALEFKRAGKAVPKGQEIMLCRLASIPEFKVLLVRANANELVGFQKVTPAGVGELVPATLEEVGELLRRWFAWAERHPAPRRQALAAA